MAVGVTTAAKRLRLWFVAFGLLGVAAATVAAEVSFPFDQELLLDTAPMRGSKRVPSIEVRSNGAAAIDLWCASGQGSVHVDGDSISIVPFGMSKDSCPPERAERDADMLSALSQITTWRLEGDAVVLIGPQMLRYRVSSH